nr:phage tail domain-containing protein [Paenibacillus sp. CECT 9249]
MHETKIRGRDRPYFQGVEKEPLKIGVSFAFEDTWDRRKIREVSRWLTEQPYYQPLYFTDGDDRQPERIYYALVVDEPSLVHNGLRQGYVRLTFRCDGPYAYSPQSYSRRYDWQETAIEIEESDFSKGERKSVTLDTHGRLVLDSIAPKWIDLPQETKWSDIDL